MLIAAIFCWWPRLEGVFLVGGELAQKSSDEELVTGVEKVDRWHPIHDGSSSVERGDSRSIVLTDLLLFLLCVGSRGIAVLVARGFLRR